MSKASAAKADPTITAIPEGIPDFSRLVGGVSHYLRRGVLLIRPVDLISPRPLFARAGEPKELFLIEGATHIDLYDKPQSPVEKLAARPDCQGRGKAVLGSLRGAPWLTCSTALG